MSPGRRTSIAPLTLGELEAFFNSAWSIFGVLAMNFGSDGYPVDQMLRFVVSVESQFYRQIGELYERRIRAWAAPQQAKPDSDHAQDGDLEPAIIVGPEPRHG